LTLLTPPSSVATAGVLFAQQPVVRVEDAYGNLRISDNGTMVSAARSAGSGVLQGTTNVTAVNGLVSFTNLSHQVATNITIGFTSGSLTSATSGTIAVSPAAASRLTILTQPSANATAGVVFAQQPKVRLEDAFGNLIASDNSTTVTASRTSGTSILQGTTTATASGGVASFNNLSYLVAEAMTIGFSSGSLSNATSSTVTVSAGAFAKLQLLAPGETAAPGAGSGKTGTPSAQIAGTAFNVTVNAVDVYWNLINTNDAVTITSSDANATLPSSTALVGGTTSLSMTFKTAGSSTVTVSDVTHPGMSSSTSPAIAVGVGVFSKLQILAPGETAAPGTATGKTGAPTVQTAGNAFSVTVNAVDANWNLITTASDTVGITSSDASAALPANGALAGGSQIFSLTLKTSGARTVTASDINDGTKAANISSSITVNAGAFVKLQLLVPGETAAPGTATGKTGTVSPQTAGTGYSVTVNAVDVNWNLVTTATDTVGLACTDPNDVLPASTALVSGSKTLSLTNRTAGAWTITASDITDNTKAPYSNPSITVNPGAFTKLQVLMPGETASAGSAIGKSGTPPPQTAGTGYSVTVNAVDANCNIVSANDTVSLSCTDPNDVLPANTALVSGTKILTLTNKTAGSWTVTATDVTDGTKTAAISAAITINPGAFVKLQLLVPGETASPGSATGKTGTPSAQAAMAGLYVTVNSVDANWNQVNAVNDVIGITTTDATATLPSNAALVSGRETNVVTFNTNGSFTITASDLTDGTRTANTSPAITVNAAQFTQATGGGSISADTASSGGFTSLTGPVYFETSGGNVGVGTIVLNAPSGFIFDTGGVAPTVRIDGGVSAKNINRAGSGSSAAMSSVTSTQLTFTVTAPSSAGQPCTLTWQNVRVRPNAGSPLASGDLWANGTATVVGLSTNFNLGNLREVPGAASLLAIQSQPSAIAVAGVPFNQQPAILIQDQFGNTRNSANGTADNSTMVTAARSAGSGVLQGTTSLTAVNGVVAYTNLSHNVATNISILFASGAFPSVTSSTVAVGPTTASALAFLTQPGNGTAGSILSTQPVVRSLDQFGNLSAVGLPASLNVTASLAAGTGPLQGTTSVNLGAGAGNGIAAFTNLRIDAAGTNKQLTASAPGFPSTVSSTFSINPAVATHLVVQTQPPASATAGAAFSTATVVSLQDQFNNLASMDNATVVSAARNQGTASLQGATNVTASGGLATFSNLSYNTAETINITFGGGSLVSATSSNVTVSPAAASKLTILTQPSSTATAGVPFIQQPVVRIEDQFGNLRTSDNSTVVSASRSAGGGTLQGSTNITVIGGLATFTSLAHNVATNISLRVSSGSLSTATSSVVVIGPAAFAKLQALAPGESGAPDTISGKTGTPMAQVAGTSFNLRVSAVDAFWNLVPAGADIVGITSSDSNAAVAANAPLTNGTQVFPITFQTVGNQTLTASDQNDATKTASTSSSIAVNPGAFAKLQLLLPGETAAPGTATGKTGTPNAQTAGTSYGVIVNAVDANWNRVASASDVVGLSTTDSNSVLPANTALSSGTRTLSLTNKTAGSWTVTATDVTDGTKTLSTSPAISVNAGAFAKLQLLVPGETAAPGSSTGKTGTPSAQTAGTAFNVTVNAVDANWNLINTNDAIAITSTDVNAGLPANAALLNGVQTFSVTLKTGGARTVTASDVTHAGITANTSPSITVNAGAYAKLQVLAPGEAASPGTVIGKTGTPAAQTAGTAVNVTVNAVDANWNLVGTATNTVGLTASDSNATLPANTALVAGTKALSVTFKTVGSQTVTASDTTDGTKSPSTSSAITVNAGAFAKLQLLMPGETAAPGTSSGKTGTPLAQTAGVAFNVTVNAVDANWNLIGTNDTVSITSSDANAALPGNAALVSGTQTFSVTLKKAGTSTVSASDVTNAGIAGNISPSLIVNPGAFAKLQILAPGETASPGSTTGKTGSPVVQTANVAFNVTVNAVDANWNLVSTASDTIGINSSDANASLPANAAFAGGTQVFSVTFKTSGTGTMTATDISDGTKTANTSSSITVNAGAFVKLQLLVPGETAAPGTASGKTGTPNAQTAGSGYSVTINAVDANWNLVNTVTDTVGLSTTDPNDVLPANTALSSGTRILLLTNKTAGSWTATATDVTDGTKTLSTSPAISVNAGAFAKLQLLVPGETAAPGSSTGKTGTPSAQTAGTAFNVTVNTVDANWNLIITNDVIAITSTDVNAGLPANAALLNGVQTFSVTLKTGGARTVTASDVTHAGITANTSPSITVNAGTYAKLQVLAPGETASPGTAIGKTGTPAAQTAGAAVNLTVNAVDANWNLVGTVTNTVGLTASDSSATLPANTALVAGTKALSVTFKTVGSQTVTVSDTTDGTKSPSTSSAITVNAGAFTKLQLLMPGETAAPGTSSGKTGTPLAQTAGTAFNVTVNAVDANWNLINTNDMVSITSSDANAALPGNAALVSGTQTFSVMLKKAGTSTVSASDVTNAGIAGNTSPSLIVNPGAFAKLQILAPGETASPGSAIGKTGTPSAQTANVAFNVTVNAVDANWNLVSTASDTIGINSSDANASLPANAAFAGGTQVFSVTFKTSGTGTMTATDISDGTKTANTSSSITVNAGAFVKLQLLVPGETAAPGTASGKTGTPNAQTAGSAFNATVNAVDTLWNVVTSVTQTVGITSSDTNATLPANAALASGTKAFSVTLKTAGSRTVTATDITDATKTANTSPLVTVVAGSAASLAMQTQPASSAVAGVPFVPQPAVRVLDAFGNFVTTDSGRTVSAARGTGTGTLQGVLTATTTGGVAAFTNLSYAVAESMTVTFTATGLTGATSGSVVISPAAVSQLAFTTQPGGLSRTGSRLATQPVVKSQDPFGNNTTIGLPASLNVSLALSAGSGSLIGASVFDIGASAGNGTVTFTNLQCSDAGTNKQLTATAPVLTSAISVAFVVGGVDRALGGIAIPSSSAGGAYTALNGPSYYEAASGDVGTGTIILNAPSGFTFDTGGTIPTMLITRIGGTGANTQNINGVASGTSAAMTSISTTQIKFTVSIASSSGVTDSLTFQNVRVRPTASSPLASGNLTNSGTAVLAAVTNNSTSFGQLIEVGPAARLTILTQPSSTATAGVPFAQPPVVRIEDAAGNLIASDNSTVVTASRSGGSGTLQGALTAVASGGLATFTNLFHTVAINITIGFASGSLTGATSASIAVGPAAATQLAFVTQPASGTVDILLPTQPAVRSLDAFGNNSIIGLGSSQMLTLTLSSGVGPLLGTASLDIGTNAGNGLAAFTDLAVDSPGTNQQLTASASGLSSAVSTGFTVTKASQTITFAPLADKTYGDAPFAVTAASSSGLPVSYSVLSGPATVAGNVVTITGVGSVTVQAAQTGDSKCNPAPNVNQSFNVVKANQTITFGPLADRTWGDAPFAVSATSSSGLPVSYSILSGPATISGNVVTITGSGTVTVQASQAGDSTRNAAPNVNQSFNVAKANQTIAFGPLSDKTYGDSTFTVSATSSSGYPVSFSILSGPATLSGSVVTITGAGTITVQASQAGDTNWNAATNVNQSFNVAKASLTVTADNKTRSYGMTNPPLTVSYSGFVQGEDTNVLSGAVAVATTATPTSSVAGGPYPITPLTGTLQAANYNFIFVPGQLTITPAASGMLVVSSANPSPTGSNVTFTATVSSVPAGAGFATGAAKFKADGVLLGQAVSLSNGVACLTCSSLAHGYHQITAEYAGDGNVLGNTNRLSGSQLIDSAPIALPAYYGRFSGDSVQIPIADLLTNYTSDADGDARMLVSVGWSTNGANVFISGNFIWYQPSTGNPNADLPDQFDYVVTDGFVGGLATNCIRISVSGADPASQPPVLTGIQKAGAAYIVRFTGIPGYSYHLQRTPALTGPAAVWTDLGSFTTDSSGNAQFTDSAPPPGAAFYRAVWQ
jgi:hypothetical protein